MLVITNVQTLLVIGWQLSRRVKKSFKLKWILFLRKAETRATVIHRKDVIIIETTTQSLGEFWLVNHMSGFKWNLIKILHIYVEPFSITLIRRIKKVRQQNGSTQKCIVRHKIARFDTPSLGFFIYHSSLALNCFTNNAPAAQLIIP